MKNSSYRQAIADYIRTQAVPPDKFSHQPRLWALAVELAGKQLFDGDVLYAAIWMHDLGVFSGHRPKDPAELARWDHVAYACRKVPALLTRFGFPARKIPAVLEVIRTHLPNARPTSFEGTLMRDADLLEQLGAVSILRTVSKVGRDTRFTRFSDALGLLSENIQTLPELLSLPSAKIMAVRRIRAMKSFLSSAQLDSCGVEW
jgi:uncharacterized protein